MYKLLLSIILFPLCVILFTSCGIAKKVSTSISENKDLTTQKKDSTATSANDNTTTNRTIEFTDNSTIEITEFYPTRDSIKTANSITLKQEVKRKIIIKKNIKQVDSSKIKHHISTDSINIKQENTIDKGKIDTEVKEKTGPTWWQRFKNTVFIIIGIGAMIAGWWVNKKFFR